MFNHHSLLLLLCFSLTVVWPYSLSEMPMFATNPEKPVVSLKTQEETTELTVEEQTNGEKQMAEIKLYLAEGFQEDSVTVVAGGAEIYRKDGVTTNYSIGIADSVDAEVPEGRLRIQVSVSNRGLGGAHEIEIQGFLYVWVRVTPEGSLEFETNTQDRPMM